MVCHEFGRFFGWETYLSETLGFRLAANVPQTYEGSDELSRRVRNETGYTVPAVTMINTKPAAAALIATRVELVGVSGVYKGVSCPTRHDYHKWWRTG